MSEYSGTSDQLDRDRQVRDLAIGADIERDQADRLETVTLNDGLGFECSLVLLFF